MTREIKLDDFGDYATEQVEKLLRAVVLETDSLIKLASPVDLGRFRASWQVGENAASGGRKPPGNYNRSSFGSAGAVQSAIPIERLGYSQEEAGKIYSVHNNLPYAEKLETGAAGSGSKAEKRYNPNRTVTNWASPGGGSSIQTAGPGWMRGIAKDVQGRISKLADDIGRTS